MASPQDGLDQCTSQLEAWTLPGSGRESVIARPLVRGPFLWEAIMPPRQGSSPTQDKKDCRNEELQDKANFDVISFLQALDQLCEETKFEESGFGYVFSLNSLKDSLVCLHRDGSFDLGPGEATRCLHVACVFCLNCLLLWLRIDLQSKDGSESKLFNRDSGLTEEVISRLPVKWKWSGDSCKNMLHRWREYIQDVDFKEEAIKLLYQWTLFPLFDTAYRVECAMDDGGDQYAEVKRVCKWGDELCDFLEDYRMLLQHSDDTEFLYRYIFKFHHRTALLHRNLGNENRVTELLETLKDMLEDIEESDLKVTEYDPTKCKISYLKPDRVDVIGKKGEVYSLLQSQGCEVDEELEEISKERKDLENQMIPNKCGFLSWSNSESGQDVINVITLIGDERYTKAREYLKQVDLKNKRINAYFRECLERALSSAQEFISHSHCNSTANWESMCEKLDLLLEICDALGDRLLTAKFLHEYGIMSARHSFDILNSVQEVPILVLRLKEALNLQLTSPAPECAQEVISCLSDPSRSDEHKRNNLPDALKAYRLLQRSIDIFSGLVHNWSTEGSSHEVEWLKLLESQKSVHKTMLVLLLWIVKYCYLILKRNDLSVRAKHTKFAVEYALHAFLKSTLVWVERGRARTLLNQLGSWYNMKHGDENAGPLKEELIKFDNDQQAALSSILSCRLACKGEPLFIEYLSQSTVDGREAMAFLTHNELGDLVAVQLDCNADQVEELVNDFYKTVPEQQSRRSGASVVAKLHSILERLYDILIEPLSDVTVFKQLDPKSTLIFVPDKMLYRVPFALLRDKKTHKYLFQLHPIAISPSLRVLQHCDRRVRELDKFPLKPEGCILAVGNAVYKTNCQLPGTGKELEHLQSCFRGRVKTFEKDEATRAKFLELLKEANHSNEQHVFAFIHLGVHGRWSGIEARNKDQPYKTGSLEFANLAQHTGASDWLISTDINSGNVIRPSQSHTPILDELKSVAESSSGGERYGTSAFGEVGVVTRAEGYSSSAPENMLPSEDIVRSGLQWRTRLVVLSACNSSRGQEYSDGEVNLPRALMIAGVPAAVVSQWSISDSASPRLMKAFYEYLRCGQDVATALQSAMLQLSNPELESANNIFEWGPFLVWGLPTVQLPEELLTENARKALPARQQVELLKCKVDRHVDYNAKVEILKELKTVETFLESVSNNSGAFEEEDIIRTIIAIDQLCCHSDPQFSNEIVALAEEFYVVHLPLEQLKRVAIGVRQRNNLTIMLNFRMRIMYTFAVKGNPQIALDYANEQLEEIQKVLWYGHGSTVQAMKTLELLVRQERAVILRLMGMYDEALKEFDALLVHWENYVRLSHHDVLAYRKNYHCLTQTSCLKYLMKKENEALEYAHLAKKLEGDAQLDSPGYGAFSLCFKALPDDYRQWLLNVDESIGVASSCIWGLPTVHLSKELWTENARKALVAKQRSELLSSYIGPKQYCHNHEVLLLKALKAVDTFLASVYDGCALQVKIAIDAIIAVEELLPLSHVPHLSKEIVALVEDVYSIDLPFEQLNSVDHLESISIHLRDQQPSQLFLKNVASSFGVELDKAGVCEMFPIIFRTRVMYVQAMRGRHQIALDYANVLVEVIQNAYRCESNELRVQALKGQEMTIKRERAIILRLMGKYDEAWKEFEDLLVIGENYECLIQTSYLKDLMKDKSGALKYASRAKKLERPDCGAFILSATMLPHEYRQWLMNVDESAGATSSFVWGLPSVQHPNQVCNMGIARNAEQSAQWLNWKLEYILDDDVRVELLKQFKAVQIFLEAICNSCALEDKPLIIDAILGIEHLLQFQHDPYLSKEVIALAEELYSIIPLEQLNVPGRGAFRLGFNTLPDEYRQWLLTVDDNEGATSSFIWGVSAVQLPEELLTENARKALVALQRAQLLKWKLDRLRCKNHKEMLSKALNAVVTFLTLVYNTYALEEVVYNTIFNIEILLRVECHSSLSKEINSFAEDVYMILPFEQLKTVEHESISTHFWDQINSVLLWTKGTFSSEVVFDECGFRELYTIIFRQRIMYTQAMRGNHQIALEYANILLEVINSAYGCGYNKLGVQAFRQYEVLIRQERAVILRLMGKYEEALKEFDELLLTNGEDYKCGIQTSYLKHLMEDKSGALEYARRAKKLEGDSQLDGRGIGAFRLSFNALPDDYRQWLLNVDENALTENARKTLATRQQCKFLRCKLANIERNNETIGFLTQLKTMDTFLESMTWNEGALEEEAIVDAIIAIEQLLYSLSCHPQVSKEIIALAGEFYMQLSSEQLKSVELKLEKRYIVPTVFNFRRCVMFTQAMKGNHQIALDYASKMIEVIQNAYGSGYDKSVVQAFRKKEEFAKQERGVILRLMGKYDEALKEFDELLLTKGKDYECLIQISYLKHLMEDKSGALEYARQAKKLEDVAQLDRPGQGAFLLRFSSLSDEYRQWLLNIDESPRALSSCVWDFPTIQLP